MVLTDLVTVCDGVSEVSKQTNMQCFGWSYLSSSDRAACTIVLKIKIFNDWRNLRHTSSVVLVVSTLSLLIFPPYAFFQSVLGR